MKLQKMKFTKKREFIYDENKFMEWCIGYSLCTVYKKSIEYGTIELWNFGYCPSNKDFYYTRNVHLPKEIKEYFNGAIYNKQNIDKMEEFGIYNGNDLQKLINLYEDAKKEVTASKIQMEIEKQKILDFRRTLKKEKKINKN